MSDAASAPHESTPDLETLIREAEARIVAADREWQRHGDQLTVVLRGHAGTAKKACTWGGVALAVVAVGTGLWRWRSRARARAEAKTVVGRARHLAQGLAKGVTDKWAGLAASVQPPAPAPVRRPTSRAWELAITTLGLLLGSAARTGLTSSSAGGRSGAGSLLFSVGLPMLSRVLRGRADRAQQPPRPPRR